MKTFEDVKNAKIEDLEIYGEDKGNHILVREGFTYARWADKSYHHYEFNLDAELEKIRNIIPPIFKDAHFDNIDKRLQEKTRELIDENGKGLYLYGGCGTGKTYSVWAMFKRLQINDVPIKILSSIRFLKLLRDDFDKQTDNYDQMQRYEGILVIDDIGTEKYSEWAGEMFYSLINKRYEQMIPTIFTSNYSIKEISEKFGDRIASRIVGMCDIIKLEGKDKRLPEK